MDLTHAGELEHSIEQHSPPNRIGRRVGIAPTLTHGGRARSYTLYVVTRA